MSDWQERITRETPPAIVAEHVLRYRLAAPLIASTTAWADLGCGNGLAPAAALGGRLPERTILVDLDEAAVGRAAQELGAEDAVRLHGDLTDPLLLARIGEQLTQTSGDRVVTCFEVVEHLPSFLVLMEWAVGLAEQEAVTFVLSVPNDAFWSIENPFHAGRWSEGAFEELSGLLPAEHTLLRQVELTGSALVDWATSSGQLELGLEVGGEGAVATHFIASFGPRHGELSAGAIVVAQDQLARRRWERQRESNLALLEAQTARQRQELETMIGEREEWRAYIHELERALGRPLAGSEAARAQR